MHRWQEWSRADSEGEVEEVSAIILWAFLMTIFAASVTTEAAWLEAAQLKSGPVFRQVDKWGNVRNKRMTGQAVATIIKDAARAAGLDDVQFSGHSLRAGFVTQAVRANVPEWQIQKVTGHKSVKVLRDYIRDEGLGQEEAIRAALGKKSE